jgi:hypothetical protein
MLPGPSRRAFDATEREGGDMDERAAKVSELLHEAAETHHTVYRITDGEDPDWASWYSDWLTRLSELPEILGQPPVRSELTALLVELDRAYTATPNDEGWEDVYARKLIRHLTATDSPG